MRPDRTELPLDGSPPGNSEYVWPQIGGPANAARRLAQAEKRSASGYLGNRQRRNRTAACSAPAVVAVATRVDQWAALEVDFRGTPNAGRRGQLDNMPARRPGTRWPPPIECTVSRVNGSADPAGGAVESALLRVSRAGKPAGGMATCRDPTAGVSKPAGTTRTPPASCHCPARRTQTPSGCGSEEPTSVMSPR